MTVIANSKIENDKINVDLKTDENEEITHFSFSPQNARFLKVIHLFSKVEKRVTTEKYITYTAQIVNEILNIMGDNAVEDLTDYYESVDEEMTAEHVLSIFLEAINKLNDDYNDVPNINKEEQEEVKKQKKEKKNS